MEHFGSERGTFGDSAFAKDNLLMDLESWKTFVMRGIATALPRYHLMFQELLSLHKYVHSLLALMAI
jgi:hypothetical protein